MISLRSKSKARAATTRVALALAVGVAGLWAADPAAAQTGYSLQASSSPDRSAPSALASTTRSGQAYVFVAPEPGVTRVRFWLDDPNRTGTLRKSEGNAPWDFAGTAADTAKSALPWDTTTVANGPHTITAVLDLSGGGTTVLNASFTVSNILPPDQVHLAWVGDPATTLDVIWRTRQSSTSSQVQFRQLGATSWQIATGALRPSGTTGTLHEVQLSGLTPATSYEYRVAGDGGQWSSTYTTRTAPPRGPADFDAIYFADTGIVGRADGLTTGTQQVIDEIASLEPDLVLPGGDYAYYSTDKRFGTLDNTIDAWFKQMQPVFTRSPMMPVYGNHEILLGEGFAPWAARFATPAGFDGRRNYSFDIGGVHFVAIFAVENTTALPAATVDWIRSDIQAANASGATWVVPYFHVAPFADGTNHPSNINLRKQLGPVFESLGVKVVLTSHDQAYERTWPLIGAGTTNTPTSTFLDCYTRADGTTWVKSSPAGKLSNLNGTFSQFATNPPPSWTAVRDNTRHHFTRLRVTAAGAIHVETYGVKGDGSPPVIQDTFQYTTGSCPDRLSLTPSSVQATVAEGGTVAPRTVALGSGGGSVTYQVTDDAPWLTVSPATGTAPRDLTLSFATAGLAPGLHRATVTATAPGRAPAALRVELTVTGDRDVLTSASPTRVSPQPLDGRSVSGNIYVFASPESGVTRASFWLDNPSMSGTPRKVENTPPWDFAGGESDGTAKPFDTRTVADGSHTITTRLDLAGGGSEVVQATFTVANGSPPPPPPPGDHDLLTSTSPTRSSPLAVEGRTVAGSIYPFVSPETGVTRASFWLDNPSMSGTPRKVENTPSWDFAGGLDDGTAKPFDTRTVANGAHTITVRVDLAGGGTEVVQATFMVANGAAGALLSPGSALVG